jgi:hypothetical protein
MVFGKSPGSRDYSRVKLAARPDPPFPATRLAGEGSETGQRVYNAVDLGSQNGNSGLVITAAAERAREFVG